MAREDPAVDDELFVIGQVIAVSKGTSNQ